MKKRWFIGILVVSALTVGLTGSAFAQASGDGEESPVKSFVSRVAVILGLDEADVQGAFEQAATEMRDEAMQEKMDLLVEQGRLTQEQANEYTEWYKARPESLTPGLGFPGKRGHGFGRRGRWGNNGLHGRMFRRGAPPQPAPVVPEGTSL